MTGELLRRVHDALRAHVAAGREPVRCGPVELFREPRGGALAGWCLPSPGAAPSRADLDEVRRRYAGVGQVARMEYLPALSPDVESVAPDAGFAVELRTPLMVLGTWADASGPAGFSLELVTPTSPDASIRGLVDAQMEAFGGEVGAVDVDAWRTRHVGIWVLARVDGEPAAGGCVTLAHRGAAEVAGIGVRAGFRRQGIAAALVSDLSRRALDAELDLVFLTPGGAEAQRIYARAGFRTAGEALHLTASA